MGAVPMQNLSRVVYCIAITKIARNPVKNIKLCNKKV